MYVVLDTFTPREMVNALNEALAGKAVIEYKETSRQTFEAMRKFSEEVWTK